MRLRHHKHKLFMTHLTSLIKCGCDYFARWQMERWMDRSEGWNARERGAAGADASQAEIINNYLIFCTWRRDECGERWKRKCWNKGWGIKNEGRMREVRSGRMGGSRVLLWMGREDGVDRLYGPRESRFSPLHENFDPPFPHTSQQYC